MVDGSLLATKPAAAASTVSVLDVLINQGLLQKERVAALQKLAAEPKVLHRALNERNLVDPKNLAKAYAVLYNLPYVEALEPMVPEKLKTKLPFRLLEEHGVVPYRLSYDNKVLFVAVAHPEELQREQPGLIKKMALDLGVRVQLAITTPAVMQRALERLKVKQRPQEPASPIEPPALKPSGLASPLKKNAWLELPPITLLGVNISPRILKRIPVDIAVKYGLVIFGAPAPRQIQLALTRLDGETRKLVDFIERKNKIKTALFRTNLADFEQAIKQYKGTLAPPAAAPDKASSAPKQAQKPPEKIVTIRSEEITGTTPGELHPETTLDTGEESNLDAFLGGKPVATVPELVGVIKSGFIPKIVAGIVSFAGNERASDIHLEPEEKSLRLRVRIDGILKEIARIPIEMQPPILSRIKILAKLKIDEQRIPQDGRFNVVAAKHIIDIRVSTMPTVHGEKAVMRLLDKSSGILTLEQLGLSGSGYKKTLTNIAKPYGIILSTGPTGSGKSTTLYAILQRISTPEVNVMTLEDPVEYEIPGINQVQIKPKIGFSFAEGLRSVLRQDPNIIMVGEIRDGETASLATNAALTGHLVLSTLHTNDAAGALPRLVNMGVEPFLITTAINAIIAQRLVRKICEHCKAPETVPEPLKAQIRQELTPLVARKEFTEKELSEMKFYHGKGCDQCGGEGFKGRVGIYEVMVMSKSIEELAVKNSPAALIGQAAIKEGMVTLKQDGFMKVLKGLSTLDEVLRVVSSN